MSRISFNSPSSDFPLVIPEWPITVEERLDLRNFDLHGTTFPDLVKEIQLLTFVFTKFIFSITQKKDLYIEGCKK